MAWRRKRAVVAAIDGPCRPIDGERNVLRKGFVTGVGWDWRIGDDVTPRAEAATPTATAETTVRIATTAVPDTRFTTSRIYAPSHRDENDQSPPRFRTKVGTRDNFHSPGGGESAWFWADFVLILQCMGRAAKVNMKDIDPSTLTLIIWSILSKIQ